MKILHVFHYHELNNGVDRTTCTLLEALAQKGVESVAIVPEEGPVTGVLDGLGIPWQRVPLHCCTGSAWRARIRFLGEAGAGSEAIGRILGQDRYDAIHLNTGHVLHAALAAARHRIPAIWHLHAPFEVDYSRYEGLMGLSGYAGLLESLGSQLIGVSDDVRASLTAHMPADRVHTVYNGIDIDKLVLDAQQDAPDIRTELGFEPTTRLVVGVGRISRQKNFGSFVRIAGKVLRKVSDVGFLIVGPPEEPDSVSEAETLIADFGLQDKIRMLGARPDVPRLLAQSDIFLSTAIFEGQGLAAIEAMALDKPVVAMACVGLRECLRDGVDSLLVPVGDERGGAEALISLLGNTEKSRALGEQGRLAARERFSSTRYADNFMTVVEQARRFGPAPAAAAGVEWIEGMLREFEEVDQRLAHYENLPTLKQKILRRLTGRNA